MAFSSIPAYLDPSNWQQQQNPPLQAPHVGVGVGSIRAGSMAERARMANIAVPETALKCPRCESTNTKFCYFNNYSLSQPRHFCKTCRRYWTRGGALRNVPVGGGCRRTNKKRSSAAKSDNKTDQPDNKNPSSAEPAAGASMLGLPPLRFSESFTAEHMGMGGYGATEEMGFHGGVEPWRMQQFPFPAAAVDYQFVGGGGGGEESSHHPKLSSSMLSQQQHASVKMEEERTARNLLLGNMIMTNEQWNTDNNINININNNNSNTVNWTHLSNFSPSSAGNNL